MKRALPVTCSLTAKMAALKHFHTHRKCVSPVMQPCMFLRLKVWSGFQWRTAETESSLALVFRLIYNPADAHQLLCDCCGAHACFGRRGAKNGGSVEYRCLDHGPPEFWSTSMGGFFRIDPERQGNVLQTIRTA